MVKVLKYGRKARQQHDLPSTASTKSGTESNGADPDKGIIKVVVRRPKVTIQQADPTRLPILLLLAHDIIDHISDYFTLIRLSQTCKTLKRIVQSRISSWHALFDRLEIQQSINVLTGQPYRPITRFWPNLERSICDMLDRERHMPWFWTARSNYDQSERKIAEELLKTVELTAFSGLGFHDVLHATMLPCYDCKRFKSSLHFFEHYKTGHLVLLGCEARLRRCIDCLFIRVSALGEDERLDDDEESTKVNLNRKTQLLLGDMRTYIIDMPKGFPGFCQVCQVCRTVRWVRTRPRRSRKTHKVCEDCYIKGLRVGRRGSTHQGKSLEADTQDPIVEAETPDDLDHMETSDEEFISEHLVPRVGGSRFELLPVE